MIKSLGIMWRAWAILLPVIVLNAGIQALLVIGDPVPGASAWFIIASVLSFIALVAAFTLVAVAMLQAVDGRVSFTAVMHTSVSRSVRMLLWSATLTAAVIIGLVLYVVPGLIVLAVFPYLLVAVADGDRSPLRANFAAIGRHPARWIVMIIGIGTWCFLLWLFTALNAFFITGPVSAFAAWSVLGLFSSWFTCAWARVWRMPARKSV